MKTSAQIRKRKEELIAKLQKPETELIIDAVQGQIAALEWALKKKKED